MRILVTGGAGFIGSSFVRYVLQTQKGVEVVNFDLLTYAGNLRNLDDVASNPRYSFGRGEALPNKCGKERTALPG